jgi:hypothetical protein
MLLTILLNCAGGLDKEGFVSRHLIKYDLQNTRFTTSARYCTYCQRKNEISNFLVCSAKTEIV